MDSRTAEIYDMEEVKSAMADPIRRVKFEDKDLIELEKPASLEEVAQGYANFDTWAEALGLKLHTRQLRRNAERRYKKAIKRIG